MSKVHGISTRGILLAKKYAKDESAATAIEYGLIAALIAVALVAGASRIGEDTGERYRCLERAMDGRRLGNRCKAVGVG